MWKSIVGDAGRIKMIPNVLSEKQGSDYTEFMLVY